VLSTFTIYPAPNGNGISEQPSRKKPKKAKINAGFSPIIAIPKAGTIL